MRTGQVGTRISNDLPPGRFALAVALKGLYGHLEPVSLEQAADRIAAKRSGTPTHKSALSRYLNGKVLPPADFIQALYSLAIEQSGESAVGVSLGEVLRLRQQAEWRRCKTCPKVQRENEGLRREVGVLRQIRAGLTGSDAAGNRARQPAVAVARRTPRALPVPPGSGDRQLTSSYNIAVRQMARHAAELSRQGQSYEVISLMRESAAVLTPLESAAAIALLRRLEQADLADAMLMMYGREQPEKRVIITASALCEAGHVDDAGTLLKAAARATACEVQPGQEREELSGRFTEVP
ncbi:hypothetical protein [Streptomyces sp. YIM 98790]|uniref:hypothetical protein n=1 Tax=Streptomyces sp. YIM 98790 TaxID=2689077 RepID=UPI0014090302|nr:hypothetical protein [Streptomyces sp. YIM 98790]